MKLETHYMWATGRILGIAEGLSTRTFGRALTTDRSKVCAAAPDGLPPTKVFLVGVLRLVLTKS
jgi:hypothetical protein